MTLKVTDNHVILATAGFLVLFDLKRRSQIWRVAERGKTSRIWYSFGKLLTLIAIIFETDSDIYNRKTML